jgi:hypothetical protein
VVSEGSGKEKWRDLSGTRERGPFVALAGVACVNGCRESVQDSTSRVGVACAVGGTLYFLSWFAEGALDFDSLATG